MLSLKRHCKTIQPLLFFVCNKDIKMHMYFFFVTQIIIYSRRKIPKLQIKYMLDIKIKPYMFCERLYTWLVSCILVGCTAQFRFSSVFPVMMVVKWSAGREFCCCLQGIKTFKANLSGL